MNRADLQGRRPGGFDLLASARGRALAYRPTAYHLIVAGLLLVYLGVNFGWFLWVFRNPTISTYVAQPLAWIAIGGIAVYAGRSAGNPLRRATLRLESRWVPAALLIGVFHVSVLIIVGLMSGFARSPYSHELQSLALNTVYLGTSIAGMELARRVLASRVRPANHVAAIWVIGILFGLMTVPYAQIASIGGPERTVHVLGTLVVPALALHVLTAYLVFRGGLLPALAYRAVFAGFEWFSPALPNNTGFIAALVSVSVAYVGYRTFASVLEADKEPDEAGAEEDEGTKSIYRRLARYGWPAATIFSVAIVWFSLGLFPYRPTSVLGESMNPTFQKGDMVILRDVDPSDVEIGDIIEYRVGTIAVVHRVIDITSSGSGPLYFTKGDSNTTADPDPVSAPQITGEMAFEIPAAGWPGIWVKQVFTFLTDR